jgi:FkbM family methyltransferase
MSINTDFSSYAMSGVQTTDLFRYRDIKVRFRKNTEDEKVLADSFDHDIFYKELPYLKVSGLPVIVDVGAHIGTFSLYSTLKFPTAKVFSFEASGETFSLFNENVEQNNLGKKIKGFHRALCSSDKPVTLYHNLIDGNWGHTISKEVSSSYEIVPGIAFSTFAATEKIEVIDLIKFNCEGAEYDIILNSPISLLEKIKCAVILYHNDLVEEGSSVDQLTQKLSAAGLTSIFLNQSRDRGWIIAVNKKYYWPFLYRIMLRLRQKFSAWKQRR